MSSTALILDLDFTLLHLEFVPDSIEVPGRTRSAWIAPQTVEILGQLQTCFDIVLATARSWDGTQWVVEGLQQRGVKTSSVVIEDGALYGAPHELKALDSQFDCEKLRARIETEKSLVWPDFAWQFDFKACLVARCEHAESAAKLQQIFASQIEWESQNLRFFRDGRKVYIISKLADKWSALQQLLGQNVTSSAGVGDGENDLVWLPKVAFPATFARAKPALVDAVRARNGFICELDGHRGIAKILREIGCW